MKCLQQRVFITGASSGIGLACAELFAREGAKLLLCARNIDKLTQLAMQLIQRYQIEAHVIELDVRNGEGVKRKLTDLPIEWHDIDVLVNNAGLALGLDKIYQGKVADWDTMIDTNIKGLLYVTRYVVANMVKRNKGHIINIGSIASHQVYSGGAVYCATKFAERAISEGLKMDLHGTAIRVSSVDPGMVNTQFSLIRFSGDEKKAAAVYENMQPLIAEDIADAVLYCATRPAHVNIREIIIYPTDQSAAHMVYRHPKEKRIGSVDDSLG